MINFNRISLSMSNLLRIEVILSYNSFKVDDEKIAKLGKELYLEIIWVILMNQVGHQSN